MAFREGVLKAAIQGEGLEVQDQIVDFLLIGWWSGCYFRNLKHQPSGSSQSGV